MTSTKTFILLKYGSIQNWYWEYAHCQEALAEDEKEVLAEYVSERMIPKIEAITNGTTSDIN